MATLSAGCFRIFRWRFVWLPLLIATFLSLVVGISVQAQTVPDGLDVPGSLAGVVTDGQANPLAGIVVTLLDYQHIPLARTVTTGADGRYAVRLLGAGAYYVQFDDPAGVYASQFYDGATTLAAAQDVVVAGQDVSGIDAVLQPAGVITGTISLGIPVSPKAELDAWLALYSNRSGTWQVEHSISGPYAGPQPFSFGGLAAGAYRVCGTISGTVDSQDVTWSQCYDGIYGGPFGVVRLDEATDIVVDHGMTRDNIDIAIGIDTDAAQLDGRVTDAAATPLAGIEVTIYPAIDLGHYWSSVVARTTTAADGDYRFTLLAPGEYYLVFADPTGEYLTRWYGGAEGISPDDSVYRVPIHAEQLRLTPFASLDVDMTLHRGAVISGTVTVREGLPPAQGAVQAALEVADRTYTFTCAIDPATGAYTLRNLPPGTYFVAGFGGVDGSSFARVVGDDTPRAFTLDYEDVVADLDIELQPDAYDGLIEGYAVERSTPLPGIRVYVARELYSWDFQDFQDRYMVYADTDATGYYRIEGMPAGRFQVVFTDPNGVYATQCSLDPYSPYNCDVQELPPGAGQRTISMHMVKGGEIQGRVGLPATSAYADFSVRAIRIILDDLWRDVGLQTDIAPDGSYRLSGLYPGTYRIALLDRSTPYEQEVLYYPMAGNWQAADDVVVAPGDAITGINLIANMRPVQYLPIVVR